MTYTEQGRSTLIAKGVSPTKVTAIGNATDTDALSRYYAKFQSNPQEILRRHSIEGRRIALFTGGLDQDKRIPFLMSAARAANKIDPTFLLLVGGEGQHSSLVQQHADSAYVRHLGNISAEQLAELSVVSEAIWMPGRIGLIAIDALALRIPIFTTSFPYHAPEYSYLKPGCDCFELPNEPVAFAHAALSIDCKSNLYYPPSDPPSLEVVGTGMANVLAECLRIAS
jgi:glycosyltransferase involved in cell wall biosynthesis